MNVLWCDMWEYRKDDLLSIESSHLAEILHMTQKFFTSYPLWRDNATDEIITVLLEGLNLDDVALMKELIEAALDLT